MLAICGSSRQFCHAAASTWQNLRRQSRAEDPAWPGGSRDSSHDVAAEIGAVRIAAVARDEILRSGARLCRTAGGPHALTPSELRVAELAAEGQTNREIAQALFLSEKTIETHLGNVYRKLGVRSCRELPRSLSGKPHSYQKPGPRS